MSVAPSTFQQFPIMNKVALRVRYPPDYQPQEEPVRLPLDLFNDLLQELRNISTRYIPSNQEFDPTSIALEFKVRDKASPSGPKDIVGKQKFGSGYEDDENRNAKEDEKLDERKVEAKPAGGIDLSEYAIDKALSQTQPSETCSPNREAENGQWNENAPFTAVTKEAVANNSNTETEFGTLPPSKQPTETESTPSTPSIPSIPKRQTFPIIPGAIGMSESRWATEDAPSKSRKPRQGGQNSRYGRGGPLSGGHSPASSRHGSIVSLQQSQEENWNRRHGRGQESSDWGDNSASAGGTNGGDWGSGSVPTPKPGDEAYNWGSDPIVEGGKQPKDGRDTGSVPAENPQAQIDSNGWGSDTASAAVHRGHGVKEESHDWGAEAGIDDHVHHRPTRSGRGARGGYGGNQEYGRPNIDFGGSNSDWNSPSAHKHTGENSDWGTAASPQTKWGENEASDNWATSGLDEFSAPRSARGGSRGDYQRGGRGAPRGRGSRKGAAQSAYNRSTDVKAGTEPAGWLQENTKPSWGDDSEAKNSEWGPPDVPQNSEDKDSPSSPTQVPTSTWDNMPGWQPSRFKKHEPRW